MTDGRADWGDPTGSVEFLNALGAPIRQGWVPRVVSRSFRTLAGEIMSRALRSIVVSAVVACVLFAGHLSAGPPAVSGSEPCATPQYKVIVHAPPTAVVVVEGEGQDRHLKLFGHCKKKERSAAAPPTYQYVQIPAMVPAATPCAPAAGPPCAAPPNACGRQAGTALENATGIVAAGQDLRATIDHLKALRAQREAEIAVIDAALAGASPTAPRQGVKAVTVSNPGPTRNEIAELSDKIDYLAALIDALAGDLKNSDPKRQLPAFDELNGLRKPKP